MTPADDEVLWALSHGASVAIRIAGPSMEPALLRGWRVRVEPVRRPLTLGDIILFRSQGGALVVHRVVAEACSDGRAWVWQMGEGARAPVRVPRERVLGVVTAVLEPNGVVLPVMQTRPAEMQARFRRARRRVRAFEVLGMAGAPVWRRMPAALRAVIRRVAW